jgi:hypothetical protein
MELLIKDSDTHLEVHVVFMLKSTINFEKCIDSAATGKIKSDG